MSIPKIYINPGHSDKDPGAVGYETERKLAVKVSNYQRDYLLAHYVCEIRMNPGTMGNLYTISKDANDWGAKLFVSNHFNACKSHEADGYIALVYSQQRRDLAQIFEKHVAEAGQNIREMQIRTGLVVLRDTNMPAIMNEGAFVDNLTDIQDWNEDHELKKLGEAYAKATAEYMKLKEKTPAEPEVPAEPEPVPEPNVQVSLLELSNGSEGPQVKTLQRLLAAMGYYKSTIDGDFGNLTEAAVKAFQHDAGIVQDGIVGQQTWSKLLGIA